jgi:hypothetical protein
MNNGVCEISKYFPAVVCNDSAKHLWGHGSVIQVCETHGKWDPLMSEDDVVGTNLALTQGQDCTDSRSKHGSNEVTVAATGTNQAPQ